MNILALPNLLGKPLTNLLLALLLLGPVAHAKVGRQMSVQKLGIDYNSMDVSYMITYPTHRGSFLPIALSSDYDGVCKYLGYERYAPGSVKKNSNADTIHINADGYGDGGPYENIIDKMVCLNRRPLIDQYSVLISNPIHRDSMLHMSSSSSGLGVCKYFRYPTYAAGSMRSLDKKDSLILDGDARVVGYKYDNIIHHLICFYEK